MSGEWTIEDSGIWPGIGTLCLFLAGVKLTRPSIIERSAMNTGPTLPDQLILPIWIVGGIVLVLVPPVAVHLQLRAVREELDKHGVRDVHDHGVFR